MAELSSSSYFPQDFLCEHARSKHRVLARLSHNRGPDQLQTVLTCGSPLLAQRIARLLTTIAEEGLGAGATARANALAADLPDAPAASFRKVVEHLQAGVWPTSETTSVSWEEVFVGDPADDEAENDEHTMPQARLSDLTAPVVRVVQLREFYMHDKERLYRAARARGFEPAPETERLDHDPEDLVGAVMHLADPLDPVPRAGTIAEESSAKWLRVDHGDEVIDWSSQTIKETFHSGSRLRRGPDPVHTRETQWGTLPDFAQLFPLLDGGCDCNKVDCPDCESWTLIPRTADILYSALSMMADEAYDDVNNGDRTVTGKDDAWMFFDTLPWVTWQMPVQWRRLMARACDDLAEDLAAGREPRPRCRAEEVALFLALESEAQVHLEMTQDREDADHEALPEHRDDYTWDFCLDILFEDHDVMLLFDPRFDGVEDPGSELNRLQAMGDMRPQSWFENFGSQDPRDPDRGFRR
ncbi:hypothetical protein ACOQFV_26380 [Nocardiopsis changdeensis]|uniref:DUF1963 domain-containing protein n=1 Tax=Nocardiopsis changdeensis TaxID=2831969 RepID=A0ABX8BFS3_9ACTN|nr:MULTISPECIES: hypothetical protein [Nocardiopsis]QUX20620.1 hypothetical protein KGD84_19155 [Nocardiopsis changdeensis]QYX36551.1 hypothetical protein K1J57_28610 [Nocardiopsis sp. MT53]